MKTLMTVSYLHAADMIRLKLGAEGIEVFMPDEVIASINPLYSNAIGGIRIQVEDSDFDRAVDILGLEVKSSLASFTCPECGSAEISRTVSSLAFKVLAALFLGTPFLWAESKFTCVKCKHVWKSK